MPEVPAGLKKLPLAKAVAVAARVAAARSPLPITSHVLLTPEEGAIRVTGTNLESRIEALAEGHIDYPLAVPARLLRDALNATQAPRLTTRAKSRELTIEDDQLRIGTGRVRFTLHGLDAQDFPPANDMGDNAELVDFDAEGLRWCARAASRDDSRPVLTGVCIDRETGVLVASDGFRLKLYGERSESSGNSIVLNAHLASIIPPDCNAVLVKTNKVNVLFSGTHSLASLVIQGTFPNFSQLIPAESSFDWSIEADTRTLAAAMNYIIPFARMGSGIVRFQGSRDDLCISARAEEVGEVEMHVACQIEGVVKVAMSGLYAVDALVCPKDRVAIKGQGPSSQVLFEYGDRRDVVMPMFVQW